MINPTRWTGLMLAMTVACGIAAVARGYARRPFWPGAFARLEHDRGSGTKVALRTAMALRAARPAFYRLFACYSRLIGPAECPPG